MRAYNGVLTVLGLACFFCILCFVFCVSVKVKLTISLLCACVHSAWKGHLRNDLYCVGWDVKPYSLIHSLLYTNLKPHAGLGSDKTGPIVTWSDVVKAAARPVQVFCFCAGIVRSCVCVCVFIKVISCASFAG